MYSLNNDVEVICNKDTAAASVLCKKLGEWTRRKYDSFISYPTRDLLIIYDSFTRTCVCTESCNQLMIEMQNADKWTERKINSRTPCHWSRESDLKWNIVFSVTNTHVQYTEIERFLNCNFKGSLGPFVFSLQLSNELDFYQALLR